MVSFTYRTYLVCVAKHIDYLLYTLSTSVAYMYIYGADYREMRNSEENVLYALYVIEAGGNLVLTNGYT